MAQTNVPSGSALAVKKYSAALFTVTQRQPGFLKNLSGTAPTQTAAEMKLKGQSSPDMSIVRVTDLNKGQGDLVSVDLVNITSGFPIMGDRNSEGKGEPLTFSSMDIKIDLTTKGVDSGGKMSGQRTKWNLRSLAMANLVGYFGRLGPQTALVHLAGARGTQAGSDWTIPREAGQGTPILSDFAEIVVNPVKAPTYNRHYVANALTLTQGGAQLASIASTDTLKLEHIDALSLLLAEMEFKMQPVKLPDDPAASDEPMYVLLVSHRAWNSVLTNTTNQVWRTFVQNAWNRASYGSKHPLFKGDTGMWNNILVKKMDRVVRFSGGDLVKHVAVANRYTAAETNVTVNAGRTVDRCLLLGAQALGDCYGQGSGSDVPMTWYENRYNLQRNLEIHGDVMNGKAKIRFNVPDGLGNEEPTDHGVLVLDVAVG